MTNYSGANYFDRVMTDAELASERKAPPAPATDRRQADAAAWHAYVDAKVKRAEARMLKLAMESVGEALAVLQTKLRSEFEIRLEREVLKLRNEFLQNQIDAERGKRLKTVVPFDKGSLIG